jgi:hypothetical protein
VYCAVVAEQIETLIPRDLAHLHEQTLTAHDVRVIAAALLPLNEADFEAEVRGVADRARAAAIFEIRDGFVELRAVVAEHADRHHRAHVAGVPVRPIGRVAAPIVTREEVVANRIHVIQEHPLEARLIGGEPAGIGTQQFCGDGERANRDAAETRLIVATRNLIHRCGPRVEDARGAVGVGSVAGDDPTQTVEIGGIRVVLRALAAGHVGVWRSLVIRLRLPVADEVVPAIDPRALARSHLGLHSVKVGLGMQSAGMHERLCGSGRRQRNNDGKGKQDGSASENHH